MSHHPEDAGGAHAAYTTRNEWVEHHRHGRSSMPRALRLTALSALLPGSGLLATRWRWLGAFLAVLALATAAVVLFFVLRDGAMSTALATAASEGRLKVILGLLVAGTVVWIGAIALTALTTRPEGTSLGQRGALAAFTAFLCLAVSAPAAFGMQYISSHLAAMDQVFTGAGPKKKPAVDSGTAPAIGADPKNPWADIPRVNILLLGSDAAEAREGTRTDTMMVASIDTVTGESVLFSIPRNLQNVPIPRDNPLHEIYPEGYNCGDQCLMNAIWTEADLNAENHPEDYTDDPNPGLTATRDVLQSVLGLEIDHTVIVNLQGFTELIDAMGGVTVTIKEPIPINGRTYTDANGVLQLDPNSPNLEWLQPGSQKLTGFQALGYSRSRVTTDDFSRMRRQRCMVAAVVDQADPLTLVQRYPQIITAIGNNVVTDIPQTDLAAWAELVLLVQGSTIKSLPFTAQNTEVYDPDYSEIRYRVWDALYGQPAPKAKPAPSADDEAATTSPGTDDDSATTAPTTDDSVTTTEPEPTDELAEIGAVCD
ncbi:LCP family protein [Ornithinimicrobium panacihumi]|uniref:LCP family protein n=1 Tax=Ornithinimicrobium panacihumi TaxID=2008449 RepID=UPI003F8B6DD6